MVKSKAKSFTSKAKKLCAPNPALRFSQGSCAGQDTQPPDDDTASDSVCLEAPERKVKPEKRRKYELRGQGKGRAQGPSGGRSQSGGSKSEAEVPGNEQATTST